MQDMKVVRLIPIGRYLPCFPSRCSYEDLTHGKASDAGKDWGQEEKGTTEDEMAGWHQRLDGREFE